MTNTRSYFTYKFFDKLWMLGSNYGYRRLSWDPRKYLIVLQGRITLQNWEPYTFEVADMKADDWVVVPHRWSFHDIIRLKLPGQYRRMLWGNDGCYIKVQDNDLLNHVGDSAVLTIEDYDAEDWICIGEEYLDFGNAKHADKSKGFSFEDAFECMLDGKVAKIPSWSEGEFIEISPDKTFIRTHKKMPYVGILAEVLSKQWFVYSEG
jgi:hypothetical protein